MNLQNKKVAIVYDRVNKFGGAERLLLILHEIFPQAPLFTSVYDEKKALWAKAFPKVITSFLQNVPFARGNNEFFGWIMPFVFESFDFSDFDLVISVTSEAAKGIITKPKTKHLSIILTPTRYLWSHHKSYFSNPILSFFSLPFISHLCRWDKIASSRPDQMIAISNTVVERIKKYYGRESILLYPPSEFSGSNHLQNKRKDFYLLVSRLVSYKKVDLAIKVFNRLGKKLVIVGSGKQLLRLKLLARKNIVFAGHVPHEKLEDYYLTAKALIMPQEEDFGLVSIEAQSCGLPVIAYSSGGSLETVIDGVTGVLFHEQNEANLTSAIAKFEKMSFNHRYLEENAGRFTKRRFVRGLQGALVCLDSGGWRGNASLAQIKK